MEVFTITKQGRIVHRKWSTRTLVVDRDTSCVFLSRKTKSYNFKHHKMKVKAVRCPPLQTVQWNDSSSTYSDDGITSLTGTKPVLRIFGVSQPLTMRDKHRLLALTCSSSPASCGTTTMADYEDRSSTSTTSSEGGGTQAERHPGASSTFLTHSPSLTSTTAVNVSRISNTVAHGAQEHGGEVTWCIQCSTPADLSRLLAAFSTLHSTATDVHVPVAVTVAKPQNPLEGPQGDVKYSVILP